MGPRGREGGHSPCEGVKDAASGVRQAWVRRPRVSPSDELGTSLGLSVTSAQRGPPARSSEGCSDSERARGGGSLLVSRDCAQSEPVSAPRASRQGAGCQDPGSSEA